MARTTARPTPTATRLLKPLWRHGPCCGDTMWVAYHTFRPSTTRTEVLRLTLQIRRCLNAHCPPWRRPYRPEAEGRLALPKHEFGLDILARVGVLRDAQHRSIPDMHQALVCRRIAIAPRTVQHLVERSEALVALSLSDTARLHQLTTPQGRVIVARDGRQPDVGHEVLWGLRDCLSGEGRLARSLLSATHEDLAELMHAGQEALPVPSVGVISDGQRSLRTAVRHALPGIPPQRCHVHSLREAAQPLYAADRHAKQALKKHVRGVRPLARQLAGRRDAEANVIRGYCQAVRSALTDDGRPPLEASGLTLPTRLSAIAER